MLGVAILEFQSAFFAFLRVNELTTPSQPQYDPEVHLSLTDVTLDNHHLQSKVWLVIKQSKILKIFTICT